jgi:hypothetical protein
MDRLMKSMIPSEAKSVIANRAAQTQVEINKYRSYLGDMMKAIRDGRVKLAEGQNVTDKSVEIQKKINDLTKSLYGDLDSLTDYTNTFKSQLLELANIENELAKTDWEEKISKLLPSNAVSAIESVLKQQVETVNDTINQINKIKTEMARNPDKQMDYTKDLIELENKLANQLREKKSLEDRLASQQEKLNKLNREFSKALYNVSTQYLKLNEVFNYGYKNNKFGNWTTDAQRQNIRDEQAGIRSKLSRLANKTDLESLKTRQSLTQRYFELIKQEGQLKLAALQEQRQATIDTLMGMKSLIGEAIKFRETAQSAVAADSTEALRLQSRTKTDINQNALTPVIEQQKQVKDIESKMLSQQNKSLNSLLKISNSLSQIARKIGTAQRSN